MKKYELTDDSITFMGHKLFRIRAIRSFNGVNIGDLGGYIEKEANLSHDNDAWIYDNVCISGNARISGCARISDNACISGNARISGCARISDNACISGYARISGCARISDNACISGCACIYDNVCISDNACISGCARISDNACISGCARISDNAYISGCACIYDNVSIFGNAYISGCARISGYARICGDAWVHSETDYLCFKGLGSQNRNTTFFKCEDGHIHVSCGCFSGSIQEFETKVKKTHGDSKYAKEYLACIEVVKIHFEKE